MLLLPIGITISITTYGRFPKFHRVFVGPRPWPIEIRHRVKQTSTIDLFGFETLKLKIRRLKLWKPGIRFVSDWTQPLDILSADSEMCCSYLSTKIQNNTKIPIKQIYIYIYIYDRYTQNT